MPRVRLSSIEKVKGKITLGKVTKGKITPDNITQSRITEGKTTNGKTIQVVTQGNITQSKNTQSKITLGKSRRIIIINCEPKDHEIVREKKLDIHYHRINIEPNIIG